MTHQNSESITGTSFYSNRKTTIMEPIKFNPVLKQTIWGGNKIIPFKRMDCPLEQVGESWEISGVEGSETTVAGGRYKGMSLTGLVRELKDKLVGAENYRRFGDTFPLLIKFLDARLDLSIQVHPDDAYAVKKGMKNGKTEMWYMLESEPGATLLSGLKKKITPDEYERRIADGTICDVIAKYEVAADDCFFIPAGRIHSTGAGCFWTEIQQTSDATYRIYDYNRKDKDGKCRELHTREASECIDYSVEESYKTEYTPEKNIGVPLVDSPQFCVAVYDLDEPMTIDYGSLDSFVIFICVEGEGRITDNEGNETTLRAGETLLIPATTECVTVAGTIKFLETYV